MISKYHKINFKSLRNNSVQSKWLYLCMYSLFSYLLRFLINQLRRLKIFVFKGEKPLQAEMEIVFPGLLLFGGMKLAIGNGKISSSRSSLFWSYHSSLFSTTNTATVYLTLNFSSVISSADNWLITFVDCNCTIPSSVGSVANASHRIAFRRLIDVFLSVSLVLHLNKPP